MNVNVNVNVYIHTSPTFPESTRVTGSLNPVSTMSSVGASIVTMPNMSWEELKSFLAVVRDGSRLHKVSFEDRMGRIMRDILPSGSKKGSQEFNDAFIEAAKITSNEWRDETEEDNSDIVEPPPLISDDDEDSDWSYDARAEVVEVD